MSTTITTAGASFCASLFLQTQNSEDRERETDLQTHMKYRSSFSCLYIWVSLTPLGSYPPPDASPYLQFVALLLLLLFQHQKSLEILPFTGCRLYLYSIFLYTCLLSASIGIRVSGSGRERDCFIGEWMSEDASLFLFPDFWGRDRHKWRIFV